MVHCKWIQENKFFMARDIFKSMSLLTPREACSAAQGQKLELVKQSSQSRHSTQAAKLKLAVAKGALLNPRAKCEWAATHVD